MGMRRFCIFLTIAVAFSLKIWSKPQVSPNLEKAGSKFIYGGLQKGDSRAVIHKKLRENGFIQIYEEQQSGVIRCAVRWDGFRFELVSKLENDQLALCLIEGNKGWQDFHYHDVVAKEWESLRTRLVQLYGPQRNKSDFPELHSIPLNDLGGVVTDSWQLSDRLVVLSVRRYELKDCCTDQMLEFSCCTLLTKPNS